MVDAETHDSAAQVVVHMWAQVVLGGSKHGLFGTLNSDYSPMAAAMCMSRLAKMAARHMGNRGFSIGIDDVTPREQLLVSKAQTIEEGYDKTQDFIRQYKKVGGRCLV